MGDIVITEFITLDGVIGTPQWTVPYQHDEIEAYKKDELFASDSQLLGRATYEMFAASWPGVTDEQGFADRGTTHAGLCDRAAWVVPMTEEFLSQRRTT